MHMVKLSYCHEPPWSRMFGCILILSLDKLQSVDYHVKWYGHCHGSWSILPHCLQKDCILWYKHVTCFHYLCEWCIFDISNFCFLLPVSWLSCQLSLSNGLSPSQKPLVQCLPYWYIPRTSLIVLPQKYEHPQCPFLKRLGPVSTRFTVLAFYFVYVWSLLSCVLIIWLFFFICSPFAIDVGVSLICKS